MIAVVLEPVDAGGEDHAPRRAQDRERDARHVRADVEQLRPRDPRAPRMIVATAWALRTRATRPAARTSTAKGRTASSPGTAWMNGNMAPRDFGTKSTRIITRRSASGTKVCFARPARARRGREAGPLAAQVVERPEALGLGDGVVRREDRHDGDAELAPRREGPAGDPEHAEGDREGRDRSDHHGARLPGRRVQDVAAHAEEEVREDDGDAVLRRRMNCAIHPCVRAPPARPRRAAPRTTAAASVPSAGTPRIARSARRENSHAAVMRPGAAATACSGTASEATTVTRRIARAPGRSTRQSARRRALQRARRLPTGRAPRRSPPRGRDPTSSGAPRCARGSCPRCRRGAAGARSRAGA